MTLYKTLIVCFQVHEDILMEVTAIHAGVGTLL